MSRLKTGNQTALKNVKKCGLALRIPVCMHESSTPEKRRSALFYTVPMYRKICGQAQ